MGEHVVFYAVFYIGIILIAAEICYVAKLNLKNPAPTQRHKEQKQRSRVYATPDALSLSSPTNRLPEAG